MVGCRGSGCGGSRGGDAQGCGGLRSVEVWEVLKSVGVPEDVKVWGVSV